MLLWSFWKTWAKSVIKVFLYNCLKQQHPPPNAVTAHLLSLRRKSFIRYENDYIQWLLLVFLEIFSASLSGSEYFVLFDSDGNGALFSNVLCDISVKFASLYGNMFDLLNRCVLWWKETNAVLDKCSPQQTALISPLLDGYSLLNANHRNTWLSARCLRLR